MTMQVRASLVLVAALAIMGLASCDHYVCTSGANFGSSNCTAGPLSLGGGGGGSTNAAFAFAVDEAGTIDSFTLNTSADTFQATTPYTAPIVPPNEEGSGMVVAQKKFLYAAFPGTGQIFGWTIGSGGGLTAIAGVNPFDAPYLIGAPSGGLQSMITNPAGTLLFVDDTSAEGVYVYQIGSSGALSVVNGSPFPVPFFPGNLTTDGLGKYLYVATETNGNQIAAYSIGSSSSGSPGALTAVSGSPFSNAMLQVQGDPSGNYLIGITGTSAGLYVFSITQSGASAGAITQVGLPVLTQYSPFSIAVQPNTGGNLVYSFSINADDTGYNPIEGYELTSTGGLTLLSGSPFSNVADGFWAQFDQSGQFLFPYSTVVNEGTGTVTVTLGVLDVGSGGALTQPISSTTLATPGFWAVTDAP
jgi:hypothetical protein